MLGKNNKIVIIDFGFVVKTSGERDDGLSRITCGTPGYMSPEILLKQPYKPIEADLFALGVLLFILVTALPPFSLASMERDDLYKLIAKDRSDMFWKFWTGQMRKKYPNYEFDPDFKDLITNMFQMNASVRLCMADVIGHPWNSSEDIATSEELTEELGRRLEVKAENRRVREEQAR